MWIVVWVLLLYDVELIISNPISTTFKNEGELDFKKEPPEVFCKKMCSYKFSKIHRKTPVPESFF